MVLGVEGVPELARGQWFEESEEASITLEVMTVRLIRLDPDKIRLASPLTEVLALDKARVDGTLDAFTSFLLVTVVTSAIEETVASLDSIEDGLGRYQ